MGAMRENIKLQKNKTLRDAKEYQRNLLKLKAMNQQSKEMKSKQRETLLDHDVITCLKLDIINGLQQEIEHLTQIWEDELNTIAELIRFQIPLQRTNVNLYRLKQQIIARQMLFKRKIRMISELRTQNRMNVSQMVMMIKQDDNDQTLHDNTIKKSFFSSLVSKTEIVEAL